LLLGFGGGLVGGLGGRLFGRLGRWETWLLGLGELVD
jgi:hypothetical protein